MTEWALGGMKAARMLADIRTGENSRTSSFNRVEGEGDGSVMLMNYRTGKNDYNFFRKLCHLTGGEK